MKLPLVVAQQEVSGRFEQPEASLGLAAAPSRALAQAGGVLAQSGLETTAIYSQAQQHLRAAEAKIESQQGLDDLTAAVEQKKMELQQSGAHPDSYVPELTKTITERGSQIATGMRYPEAQQDFMLRTRHYAAGEITKAKWDALSQKNALVEMSDQATAVDEANRAVWGATEMERQAAVAGRLERLDLMQRTRIYSADKASSIAKSFMTQVQTNQIFRDGQDPAKRPQLLEALHAGQYVHIHEPDQMADTLNRRWDAEDEKAQRKIEKDTAAAAEEFAKDAYSALRDQTRTIQDLHSDPKWKLLKQHMQEHLDDMAANPKLQPSDPAAINEILLSWPRVSVGRIQQMRKSGALNTADAQHWLMATTSREDHYAALNRADALDQRRQAVSDIDKRHRETMQLAIDAVQVTGPLAQIMSGSQLDAQAQIRASMIHRSKGAGVPIPDFPRNEDPEAVIGDILPALIAKTHGTVDTAAAEALNKLPPSKFKTPQDLFRKYPGDPSQYSTNEEYKNALQRFAIQRSADENKLRLEKKLDDIRKHGGGLPKIPGTLGQ